MEQPYNPLDKIHIGENIRDALLKQTVHQLEPGERFPGAGIYAIYYTGTFPAYQPVTDRNRDGKFDLPIYVGEAVPEGSRKGGLICNTKSTYKLHQRLREHAGSIAQANNLHLDDFHFRFLVVDDIWIPLGEALMIHTFAPLWNKIGGFGIHTPGGNRPQMTSAWDTLHPGRPFVARVKLLPNPKSRDQWMLEVQKYLALPKRVQLQVPRVEMGEED
ncbi:MAG: Eco29kI family restriction endonuclease [Acidobacteriota bacterium]|nr:Eco29kI family restriction endonuclease [Acidobacteriota bacterium]